MKILQDIRTISMDIKIVVSHLSAISNFLQQLNDKLNPLASTAPSDGTAHRLLIHFALVNLADLLGGIDRDDFVGEMGKCSYMRERERLVERLESLVNFREVKGCVGLSEGENDMVSDLEIKEMKRRWNDKGDKSLEGRIKTLEEHIDIQDEGMNGLSSHMVKFNERLERLESLERLKTREWRR
jgi:hypothetical protein